MAGKRCSAPSCARSLARRPLPCGHRSRSRTAPLCHFCRDRRDPVAYRNVSSAEAGTTFSTARGLKKRFTRDLFIFCTGGKGFIFFYFRRLSVNSTTSALSGAKRESPIPSCPSHFRANGANGVQASRPWLGKSTVVEMIAPGFAPELCSRAFLILRGFFQFRS